MSEPSTKDRFLPNTYEARVAELVDARDLKSLESNLVPVRLRPWAYEINIHILLIVTTIILLQDKCSITYDTQQEYGTGKCELWRNT